MNEQATGLPVNRLTQEGNGGPSKDGNGGPPKGSQGGPLPGEGGQPAAGASRTSQLEWYMPGSVLSALWGKVMPRLAARVWRTQCALLPRDAAGNLLESPLQFPPRGSTADEMAGVTVYPIQDDNLPPFWNALAEIMFPGKEGVRSFYSAFRPKLSKPRDPADPSFNASHQAAHAVLEYFHPDKSARFRMPLRFIRGKGYDFVLHSGGLDVFVPPNPAKLLDHDEEGAECADESFDTDPDKTRALVEILRMYRFRATGSPPIGLPGVPATSKRGDYLMPTLQLSAPTGVSLVSGKWVKRIVEENPAWWITGSVYRGIMAELPRIIASFWHEKKLFPRVAGEKRQYTYTGRFRTNLKTLLEQRLETTLPKEFNVQVGGLKKDVDPERRWNPRDVMITNRGLVIPDRTPKVPELNDILVAIERGAAGNPVFTDSGPGDPE